jgi:hypothetical protein
LPSSGGDNLHGLSYFLKLEKCEFKKSSVEFLRWLVTSEGITMDPSKAEGLAAWPRRLWNVKEVRRMLGILGYQCPFIQGYTKLAKPLTDLTHKGVPFEWEE